MIAVLEGEVGGRERREERADDQVDVREVVVLEIGGESLLVVCFGIIGAVFLVWKGSEEGFKKGGR